MRRRSFLAATATGVIAGVSGCLEGDIVLEKKEQLSVPAHQGWSQKISGVGGSGEIGYSVKSEDDLFEILYYRDKSDFETYQQHTMGGEKGSEQTRKKEIPKGDSKLSQNAFEENGVYQAEVPDDGGRTSVNINGTHYFVIDYSNYGVMPVDPNGDRLTVTLDLEVVKSRF